MDQEALRKYLNPKKPWTIAGGIALLIVLFLLSAESVDINDPNKPLAPDAKIGAGQSQMATVVAQQFPLTKVAKTLTLYGATQTDRTVTVSAEVAARVTAAPAAEGSIVKEGDELIQLNEGSLRARLNAASARVKQAKLDFKSAQQLDKNNHIADNTLVQLEADLAEAYSAQAKLTTELANTRIKAPISGILNNRLVEVGDFTSVGSNVAEILDLDPLVVRVDVPQNQVRHFAVGQTATVRFADGEPVEGTIRFVNKQSDAATRTFALEIAVPNPETKYAAGLSVEADLTIADVDAVTISPAWISLDELGNPGVKWVNNYNIVQFTPIEIAKSTSDTLWVTGIPVEARIITRGQGFVRAGDSVKVTIENGNNALGGF